MTSSESSRIEWIDTAKALSIILVTLLHVTQLSASAGLSVQFFEKLNFLLAPVRMPLFFAAAGVFAGSALAKPWSFILGKRVALYLWLFVAWTVIRWTFAAYVVPNPDAPSQGNAISEIAWMILMPTTGLWFLWSLAIFFVVAKLLRPLSPRATAWSAIIITIAALGLRATQSAWVPENLAHRNTIIYFSFFYTAATYPSIILSLGKLRSNLAMIILAAIFVACYVFGKRSSWAPVAGIFLFTSSLAGVAALFQLARTLDAWKPIQNIIRYIGKNTLPIYVSQVPIICVYILILNWFGAKSLNESANLLMLLGVALVTIAALAVRSVLTAIGLGGLYTLPSFRKTDLPPAEWPRDHDSLYHERDDECRARSTSRKRSSASA